MYTRTVRMPMCVHVEYLIREYNYGEVQLVTIATWYTYGQLLRYHYGVHTDFLLP